MPTLVQVLTHLPVPLLAIVVLLRYAPSALLVLLAGVVAVAVRGERGERALTVLRMLLQARRTRVGRTR